MCIRDRNRIVDYNKRKPAEGYAEMQVSFTISDDIRKNLTFDDTNRLVERTEYTEKEISEIVGAPTSIAGDISGGEIRELETKYGRTKIL